MQKQRIAASFLFVLLVAYPLVATEGVGVVRWKDGNPVAQDCRGDEPCTLGHACVGEVVQLEADHSTVPETDCFGWDFEDDAHDRSCHPEAQYQVSFDTPGLQRFQVSSGVDGPTSRFYEIEVVGPPQLGDVQLAERLCLDDPICLEVESAEGIERIDWSGITLMPTHLGDHRENCGRVSEVPESGMVTVTATGHGVCGGTLSKQKTVFVSACRTSERRCCDVAPVRTEHAGHFALDATGNIVRAYWTGQPATQIIPVYGPPIVLGSMVPRGGPAVAAVNEAGQIVITWNTADDFRFAIVQESRNIEPCSLEATSEGIFGVTNDGELVRTYWDGGAGSWRSDIVDTWGNKIVPGSLTEIGNGRVIGHLQDGGMWNVYHGDQGQLVFGISQVDAVFPPLN